MLLAPSPLQFIPCGTHSLAPCDPRYASAAARFIKLFGPCAVRIVQLEQLVRRPNASLAVSLMLSVWAGLGGLASAILDHVVSRSFLLFRQLVAGSTLVSRRYHRAYFHPPRFQVVEGVGSWLGLPPVTPQAARAVVKLQEAGRRMMLANHGVKAS